MDQPAPQRHEISPEDMDHSQQMVDDALEFVFNEFDTDKDGLVERKEFFELLFKLKAETGYKPNEYQMISCWKAVDVNNTGRISFEDFKAGLETIYENHFYAKENGAPIPDSQVKLPAPITLDDSGSYNTIRIKNSAAVAIFGQILDDEKNKKAAAKSSATAAHPPATEFHRRAPRETPVAAALSSADAASPSTTTTTDSESSKIASASTAKTASTSSGAQLERQSSWASRNNPVDKNRPTGLARAGFNAVSQHDQDRDKKRKEADEQVQKILAERHKEERRKREEERIKKTEEVRVTNSRETDAMMSEPAWKKNLRAVRN